MHPSGRVVLQPQMRQVLADKARRGGPFAGTCDDARFFAMNQLFRKPDHRSADLPLTTQAAGGLARGQRMQRGR